MNKTPIYLDEEEIEIFKWIWVKYDSFKLAKKILTPGYLIIHCDEKGIIKKCETHLSNDKGLIKMFKEEEGLDKIL